MKASGDMPRSVLTSGGRLQITEFTPETDVGHYACKGVNDAGVSMAGVDITEAKPPVVSILPHGATREVGTSVKFVCSLDNGLNSDIRWTKDDGDNLDADQISSDGSVVMLHNITTRDAGS
uniref:Ig-like domain-containing protein n=1 Tax=Ciona savignyi TaxID=51511 RepID=H2YI61_CIOSA